VLICEIDDKALEGDQCIALFGIATVLGLAACAAGAVRPRYSLPLGAVILGLTFWLVSGMDATDVAVMGAGNLALRMPAIGWVIGVVLGCEGRASHRRDPVLDAPF
jgi:hypothetical protein